MRGNRNPKWLGWSSAIQLNSGARFYHWRIHSNQGPLIFIKGTIWHQPFTSSSGVMEESMLRCRRFLLAMAVLIATTCVGAAQGTDTKPSQPEQTLLKPEQLDALVAPIALYPDELLANVLAASTYPLEVVQADRWLDEHKKLKGDALKAPVDKQAWDESIKALVATPSVLSIMNDKLDWTKALGDAVLAQQADVMEAVQRLRSKAYENKKLSSTKEQKVTVQQQENKQLIVIEPTDPGTLYVPYYEPAVVYGSWPYAEYPPYYFAAPPYVGAGLIATGLAFGAGYALGRWNNYWGGGFRWGNNNFFINRSTNINPLGNNWQHNPAHRQGVRYNNAAVQQKFGNNRAGGADRMDFRGRGDQGLAGKDRPGAGDRAGAGDRGKADRAAARDRAGSDKRGGGAERAGNRAGGNRAKSADRSRAVGAGNRGGRDTAIRNMSSGRAANLQSARGWQSFASAGVSRASLGGGRSFSGGGGGGFRGGGGGGFRGGGGGRRSDVALKHDVVLLGHLDNGLGYYRFSYLGSAKVYVGVIAQEVQTVMPDAVTRGSDGYLRVYYGRLGIKFRKYRDWVAAGAKIPTGPRV
jgi:Protein of unknown function (DUF3300)